jgi:hypothetical protein
MGWQQRLKEAAYTSPSGERVVFTYENVSKETDKKTTAFDFPDLDGTYIQDLGHSGRKYPLRIIFWGDNYDEQAKTFDKMLDEKGPGRLEHPLYGTLSVVPFGKITRRDDLKTAANQCIYQITFWETIQRVYPDNQKSTRDSIFKSLGQYAENLAGELVDLLGLSSAVEKANFKESYQNLLGSVQNVLGDIADVQEDTRVEFNAIHDSIDNAIDILVDDPATLAFQTVQLIQTPGRTQGSIVARLSAYRDLLTGIITGNSAVRVKGLDSQNSNAFHTDDLYASTYISGAVVSVLNHEYVTRSTAIESADAILTRFEELTNWRDDNFQSLEEIDVGSSYQQLQESVALTAAFITELSFSLKQEKSIILDRNRTIIDLSAQLYGEVDPQLDFMITSNDLSGDEIIELPRGKEVVYFV